jgi:hypothetical protein
VSLLREQSFVLCRHAAEDAGLICLQPFSTGAKLPEAGIRRVEQHGIRRRDVFAERVLPAETVLRTTELDIEKLLGEVLHA